jgi:hypothetical protein
MLLVPPQLLLIAATPPLAQAIGATAIAVANTATTALPPKLQDIATTTATMIAVADC